MNLFNIDIRFSFTPLSFSKTCASSARTRSASTNFLRPDRCDCESYSVSRPAKAFHVSARLASLAFIITQS